MVSVTVFTFQRIACVSYGVSRLISKAVLALFLVTQSASASDPAETITLLAFGDSLTHGYGLPAQDGFVPQLQEWLVAHGNTVTVINGGVSGDTSAGGAARIDWSLSDDINAIIVALGGNDALRGLRVEDARQNFQAILNSVKDKGIPVLLVGIHAPLNFGVSYAQDLDAMYVDLAEEYNIPLFPDFLQGIAETGDRQAIIEKYLQGDALHPNAEGVKLIVVRMGPVVQKMLLGTP